MSDEQITPEVEQIITEAQEDFDLFEEIVGRPMRTRKLTLGFDEVNGEKLVILENAKTRVGTLVAVMKDKVGNVEALEKELASVKRKRTGDHAAEIADLQAKLDAARAAQEALKEPVQRFGEIEKEVEEVRSIVKAKSISIELRALPPKIRRGVVRKARKALGITDKGIPEERMDEYTDRYYVELASAQVVRWRDNRNGKEGFTLTPERIQILVDNLPEGEGNRLLQSVAELQERTAISEAAVAQADF